MTGPVVVGTDGSDHATRAVRWAAGEAAARSRPLRIAYATGHGRPYLSQEDSRQIDGFAEGVLEEAVALAHRLDPAVPVTTAVCENEPAACLLGEAGSAHGSSWRTSAAWRRCSMVWTGSPRTRRPRLPGSSRPCARISRTSR
ncbi:universal stress protein [Streptomyces sp. NBC_01591]|uniref:universal stress protein n=1 Tax=Streptomyces sp. NBC_01591 TaxID=2975888 RepID=UPI002DDB1F46|nr:universal stress protein [Streptomyces sp. NBC_01591]WSD73548.1 universal stress protein [Streptomyces sp. NBC_01591]